jgi:hypothetical protein
MNPFKLPETRRPGTDAPNPLAAAAGLPSSRLGGRQTGGDGVNQEVVLLNDGDDDVVEAPPLTMIGPKAERPTKDWKFWKRPNKRTQELIKLREGCESISGVMLEVRNHIESANEDRQLLRKTLSPLPLAVDGLRRIGDNQRRTHEILENLNECVERTNEKDAVFFKAMDRLNEGMGTMDMVVVGMGRTFSSIERNSKASTATLDKLAERIDSSDRFMESAFKQMKESEKDFTNFVDANSRRSAIVTVTICALMTLGITMLAYTMSRPAAPVAPVENVSAPSANAETPGND